MHIEIEGKMIGNNQKPYIVAELSANHNGSIQTALDTIKAAKAYQKFSMPSDVKAVILIVIKIIKDKEL